MFVCFLMRKLQVTATVRLDAKCNKLTEAVESDSRRCAALSADFAVSQSTCINLSKEREQAVMMSIAATRRADASIAEISELTMQVRFTLLNANFWSLSL